MFPLLLFLWSILNCLCVWNMLYKLICLALTHGTSISTRRDRRRTNIFRICLLQDVCADMSIFHKLMNYYLPQKCYMFSHKLISHFGHFTVLFTIWIIFISGKLCYLHVPPSIIAMHISLYTFLSLPWGSVPSQQHLRSYTSVVQKTLLIFKETGWTGL